MNWDELLEHYKQYLIVEKGLSKNTFKAYCSDIQSFILYCQKERPIRKLEEINLKYLEDYISYLNQDHLKTRSQARKISSIKSFFNYLELDDFLKEKPSELLESPKLEIYYPEVLSLNEVERIIAAIEYTNPVAYRSRAIVETLYSCGLRVSELSSLLISNINFEEKYIKVLGKGSKERILPIGTYALDAIQLYFENYRSNLIINPKHSDYLFLNYKGERLSRISIFKLIKELALKANISKTISPHTFRHTFASHLVDRGADIRIVQELLGHESILTTEIYTKLNNEFYRDTLLQFHPRSRH